MMPAVQTAQEKFQTDDVSRSKGEQKISNDQPFEWLTKNFEWMLPAARTAKENFKRVTSGVRTP